MAIITDAAEEMTVYGSSCFFSAVADMAVMAVDSAKVFENVRKSGDNPLFLTFIRNTGSKRNLFLYLLQMCA